MKPLYGKEKAMPVWYRSEPDENGEAVEIFRGTVYEMAQALDAAKLEIRALQDKLIEMGRYVKTIEESHFSVDTSWNNNPQTPMQDVEMSMEFAKHNVGRGFPQW